MDADRGDECDETHNRAQRHAHALARRLLIGLHGRVVYVNGDSVVLVGMGVGTVEDVTREGAIVVTLRGGGGATIPAEHVDRHLRRPCSSEAAEEAVANICARPKKAEAAPRWASSRELAKAGFAAEVELMRWYFRRPQALDGATSAAAAGFDVAVVSEVAASLGAQEQAVRVALMEGDPSLVHAPLPDPLPEPPRVPGLSHVATLELGERLLIGDDPDRAIETLVRPGIWFAFEIADASVLLLVANGVEPNPTLVDAVDRSEGMLVSVGTVLLLSADAVRHGKSKRLDDIISGEHQPWGASWWCDGDCEVMTRSETDGRATLIALAPPRTTTDESAPKPWWKFW